MTTQPRQRRFTADEFIAWAIEQPEGRYELAGGEIVAMAPERVEHARVKAAVFNALGAGISARGLGCEAMIDGVAVRIDAGTVYEPDALVRCGERSPGAATSIDDPVIVVEAVSPSSRAIDSGAKLTDYFALPSLRHYLVVNIDARAVAHHRRDDQGGIATRILRDGALDLEPPGIAVEVGDLFATL
jgi:Uma2 family endonuclease